MTSGKACNQSAIFQTLILFKIVVVVYVFDCFFPSIPLIRFSNGSCMRPVLKPGVLFYGC